MMNIEAHKVTERTIGSEGEFEFNKFSIALDRPFVVQKNADCDTKFSLGEIIFRTNPRDNQQNTYVRHSHLRSSHVVPLTVSDSVENGNIASLRELVDTIPHAELNLVLRPRNGSAKGTFRRFVNQEPCVVSINIADEIELSAAPADMAFLIKLADGFRYQMITRPSDNIRIPCNKFLIYPNWSTFCRLSSNVSRFFTSDTLKSMKTTMNDENHTGDYDSYTNKHWFVTKLSSGQVVLHSKPMA